MFFVCLNLLEMIIWREIDPTSIVERSIDEITFRFLEFSILIVLLYFSMTSVSKAAFKRSSLKMEEVEANQMRKSKDMEKVHELQEKKTQELEALEESPNIIIDIKKDDDQQLQQQQQQQQNASDEASKPGPEESESKKIEY